MSEEFRTQKCNECEKELPIYEFGFSPTRGTNFTKCKSCTKNRRKTWYQKDPNLLHGTWRKKKAFQKL